MSSNIGTSSALTQQSEENSAKAGMVSTTCPYCGVGCGVDASVDRTGPVPSLSRIKGTPCHPANHGRLCVKGSHLAETNSIDNRLLFPQLAGRRCEWSTAIQVVADKFNQVIAEHGPDAVAFYVSGQLLTEDYYVANKLMKGYIGSANIDTNSRLCMSSAVAAQKRAFGADAVPCCYEDLEQTDLLVLVGSNAAWTHPVLFQRVERAKKLRPEMQLVVIDPRRSATCASADMHLPLKPGTDVALFNGLLNYLATHQHLDQDFIDQSTQGFDACLQRASHWGLEAVAKYCELPVEQVLAFYQRFALSPRSVTMYSMGVNQSSSGVDKANSIINCHLANGQIGKVGTGPYSITGQPNAMGGREVGGLANMLAAHMDIDNPQHREWVQQYWQSPNMPSAPGAKAVELFDKVKSGEIKALWIMATNPLVSMPDRNQIEAALAKCEMVVVSDVVANNDTLAYADVAFPATAWSEKNGTVSNSERRISRQRGILPPPGESRHDWEIICQVARAMGFEHGFDFQHPKDIFCEHAGLTGWHNDGSRALDISALSRLSTTEYDRLQPVQWPVNQSHPDGLKRLFGDGRFFTADGKARFIPLTPKAPQQITSADFPFVLNSGRLRDQWHTMTRTGKASALLAHSPWPQLSLHPADAAKLGIEADNLVAVRAQNSAPGQLILAANIDEGMRPGEVFAPIHWSGQQGSAASIASVYTGATDPLSGQPELKHAAVALSPQAVSTSGFLLSRYALASRQLAELFDYWQSVKLEQGTMYRIACFAESAPSVDDIRQCCNSGDECVSLIAPDRQTTLCTHDDRVSMFIEWGRKPAVIDLDQANSLLDRPPLSHADRVKILRGELSVSAAQGKTVCSCFQVREGDIRQAIEDGCDSVEALGQTLQCGTNCGSCKSELAQLLNQTSSEPTQPPATAIKVMPC